jgi:hypothetical protein
MTTKPGPASDFDTSPAMQRAAFDVARRDFAMGRGVDVQRVADALTAQGYRTSARTVDRFLRRAHPELFNRKPHSTA